MVRRRQAGSAGSLDHCRHPQRCRRLRSRDATDDEGELAAGFQGFRPQLGGRTDQDLFVQLGQLAADGDLSGRDQLLERVRAAPRCGVAPRTAPAATRPSRWRRAGAATRPFARLPGRGGRKPPNRNPSDSTPAAAIAAVTAEGPGRTSTDAPAARAASTRRAPGSETPGIPASVVNASVAPRGQAIEELAGPRSRRMVVVADRRPLRPEVRKEAAGHPGVLGDNQVGVRSASAARGVRSPRLPIGVPTTSRRPATLLSSRAASRAGGAGRGGRRRACAG